MGREIRGAHPGSTGTVMIFHETKLAGAYVVEIELLADERGFFARTWCEDEFRALRLNTHIAQCNVSYSKVKGTVRGMHYQAAPYEEAKLIRCTKGAIFDVIIDLREGSPTFAKHVAVVLSEQNRKMLYVPEGLAHGFQTLEDETEVFYQMSQAYVPGYARGVRWDDPAFGIQWPEDVRVISQRDRSYPDFAAITVMPR